MKKKKWHFSLCQAYTLHSWWRTQHFGKHAVQNTSSVTLDFTVILCVWEGVIYTNLILYVFPDTSLQSPQTLSLHCFFYFYFRNPVQSSLILHILHQNTNFHLYCTPTHCFSNHAREACSARETVSIYWAVVSLHSLWLAGIHRLDNTYRRCWTMTWWGKDTIVYT